MRRQIISEDCKWNVANLQYNFLDQSKLLWNENSEQKPPMWNSLTNALDGILGINQMLYNFERRQMKNFTFSSRKQKNAVVRHLADIDIQQIVYNSFSSQTEDANDIDNSDLL